MIDTLYLHIGAPKTGTTTLQNVLFEARQELRAHEVFFPDVAANHYFLASAFHQNPQNLLPNKLNGRTTTETLAKYHKENLGKVQEQATAKNWPYGILSTESLTILQHQGISNLRSYLMTIAQNVKVVCYVRHPIQDAISRAQQNIKVGSLLWEDFFDTDQLEKVVRTFDAERCLAAFSATFGADNIIVRHYDRNALVGNDIVADFLSILGLPPMGDSGTADNTSLSQEAVLVASLMNKHLPRLETADRPGPNLLRRIKGRKFQLPSPAINWINQRSTSLVATLASYGLEMAPYSATPYVAASTDSAVLEVAAKYVGEKNFKPMIREINSLLI